MTDSIIVTIGDELLIGQVMDTNSVWISKELNKYGISIKQKLVIADNKEGIISSLKFAMDNADVVIITGGLGPTQDDLTKESLCALFDSKLVQNEAVLAHIKDIFKTNNKPVLFQNLKQAEVPHNCKVLFNKFGTAPGMLFEQNGQIVISLPGVPYEMQTIMEDSALPFLKSLITNENIYHKTLMVTGIGESAVAEQISDIEANLPQGFNLAYLPGLGLLKLRITASGIDKTQLIQEVDYEANKIKNRIGNYCIAEKDSSIEVILSEILMEKQYSLGLAESCTGGYIAHKITNLPGSSHYFKGSIVCYSNEIKKRILSIPASVLETVGAVSEETVRIMAESALSVLEVDYALSVSGILGPTGATPEKPVGVVWMAIACKNKIITRKFHVRYDRVRNKELAANLALDWLRETILRAH